MSRAGHVLRWVVRIAVGLVVLLVLVTASGWAWLRTSVARLDGTLTVPGLEAAVTISRDGYGIPYIAAASEHDAHFALGFVHAQDRLAQMEFMRRLGTGRLSELLGPNTLGLDRTMRTLGIGRLAQRDLETLPPDVREALDAYTAGVNGFLATRTGALPPEFWLLWGAPEPWTAADSLLWGRLMALRLTDNWRTELLRAALAQRLPADRVAALWPEHADAPVSIGDGGTSSPDHPGQGTPSRRSGGVMPDDARTGLASAITFPPADTEADGSNAWAVAGSRTPSGRPVLANDPHLGHALPNHWYLVRIDAPGLTLAGASAPGSPFLVLGHNGHVAWALTTTHGDASDLFVERLAGDEPARYDTPNGPQPFASRQERIAVRWQEDVTFTVRTTRHGPVVSDVYPAAAALAPPGHVVALAHIGLSEGDINAAALHGANRARDLGAMRSALARLRAPQQNVLSADHNGNIALDMPALIPIRRNGDGSMPVPGWTGENDWAGFVPFEARPQATNPPEGWLANANNRLVGDDYPYPITATWPEPYRAMRLAEVLSGDGRHGPQDAARLQLDIRSPGACAGRDALLAMGQDAARTARAARAVALLRAWDCRMARNRPEPLIYAAWTREAMQAIYADELGAAFAGWWAERPLLLHRTVFEDDSWCDQVGTPAIETCPDRLAEALETALDRLEREYGADPSAWRWGDAHAARFEHVLLSRLPWVGSWFGLEIPSDGGNFTVNRGGYAIGREDAPFEQIHGAGFRAVYDLADLDRSLFMQSVGQSGNPFSPHYADLMPLWRDGRYVRLVPPERPAHLLRLEPAETTR